MTGAREGTLYIPALPCVVALGSSGNLRLVLPPLLLSSFTLCSSHSLSYPISTTVPFLRRSIRIIRSLLHAVQDFPPFLWVHTTCL